MLYNGTSGSLLLVAVAHSAENTTAIFMPVASTSGSQDLGAFLMGMTMETAVVTLIVASAGSMKRVRAQPTQATAYVQRRCKT